MRSARALTLLTMLGVVTAAVAAPSQLWQVKTAGYADKPAAADLNCDGRLEVVLCTDKGSVMALNGVDGTPVWQVDVEDERFLSCPVIVGQGPEQKVLAVGARYGTVICLNGPDGSEAWRRKGEGDGILGSAAGGELAEGQLSLVYVLKGKVYCLDAATGAERWTVDLLDKSDGSATIADLDGGAPEILAGTNGGQLRCLSADGQIKWSAKIGGRATKPALVTDADGDGKVEIYTIGAGLVRVDPTGKLKWTWNPKGGRGASSSVAVFGKSLAVCCYDGGLYIVNPLGKQVLRYALVPAGDRSIPGSTPAIVDVNNDKVGDLLVCSPRATDPRLLAIDGKTGKLLWSATATMFSQCCPIVLELDGQPGAEVVWCCPTAGSKGTLTAIKAGFKATGGWLKFNGDLGSAGCGACAKKDAALLLGLAPAG